MNVLAKAAYSATALHFAFACIKQQPSLHQATFPMGTEAVRKTVAGSTRDTVAVSVERSSNIVQCTKTA
jgi:hypothetical protein